MASINWYRLDVPSFPWSAPEQGVQSADGRLPDTGPSPTMTDMTDLFITGLHVTLSMHMHT